MKKSKIFNLIMIPLIVLTFCLFLYSTFNPFLSPVELDDFGENVTIGVINKNTTITQKFISNLDSLDSIQIQYATFDHENEGGNLIIEIFDSNNKNIYYNEYNIEEIKNGDNLRLEFDVQKKSKNKEYILKITCEDVTKDDVITFYAVTDNDHKLETNSKLNLENSIRIYQYGEDKTYFFTMIILAILFIEIFIFSVIKFKNKKHKELRMIQKILLLSIYIFISLLCSVSLVDIGMDIFYENRLSIISLPIFIITGILILITIAKYITFEKIKLEKLFLILAIPLSCLYLIIFVPGNKPDEPYHYRIAYQISKGNFLLKNKVAYNDGNKVYFDYQTAREELIDKTKDTDRNYDDGNGGYNPLLYIFSSVGILIGRIFNLTLLGTKYLGSFFNVLLFLLSGYYIIKLLPYGKYLGLIYLLNPMNLHQMTSLSCDAMINASSLLFIAYILNLNNSEKKIEIKDMIWLALLLLIILVSKFAYFPLVLLLFLLKNNIKKFNKKYKKIFVAILAIVALLFLGMYIYNKYNVNPIVKDTEIKLLESKQPQTKYTKLEYLLTSPTKAAYMLLNTLHTKIDFYVITFAGQKLGALNIDIDSYIITLYLILLVVSAYFDSEKNNLKFKEKSIILMTFIFNFGLILAGLYLGWGNLRDLFVEGVQGRYFIPIVILPLLLLQNKNIKFNIDNKNLVLSILIVFINIYIIMQAMTYYLN